jgi:type II secretory pathway component PulJ
MRVRNHDQPHARAYTIWEMLIAVMLLGAAGLLMPRIFTSTMRVVREAPAASNAIASHHALLEQLRRDAWGAGETAPAEDGRSLRVSLAGQEIRWSVQPRQAVSGPEIEVTRTAGDERRTWILSAVTMQFERSPAGVLVRFGSEPAADDSILLVNQLAQLRRGGGGGAP